MPNITGKFGHVIRDTHSGDAVANGCFYGSDYIDTWLYSGQGGLWTGRVALNINAFISSSIYGNSTTVRPTSCECVYILKY